MHSDFMKKITLLSVLIFSLLLAKGQEKTGYEINVTFKPFKNTHIYLGHYFGKSYPIIDSALLNENSEAVFKGDKILNGGIYLIGYPNKAGFFEVLVDKQQHFSIIADTATLAKGIKFENSSDNVLFNNYQQYMSNKGNEINKLRASLKLSTSKKDSSTIKDKLVKIDKDISVYRGEIIKKNPGNILTALLMTMKEPALTGRLQYPKTKKDSLDSWQYFKSHYWDDVSFYDGRMAYTTFFEEKLDKYFSQLVVPDPDSVIYELDWMLGTASISPEMTRFLLVKFMNRYLNQKYMWEDGVFIYLYEKYFSQKNYSWLTEAGKKTITDRAYSLMANIMGTPASEITLPDSSGKLKNMFDENGRFTIVIFWDPTCGHCKEVLPQIDSVYRAKWKADSVHIYAVSKETDGTKKDWLDFINEKKLKDWTHVYYSKADDKARTDNNIPGYSQLYDVLSFPTIYLLDKDKRIIAKKLALEQIDDVLQLKIKGK